MALSQQGLCKPCSLESSPLLCLASASALLASIGLSSYSVSPLKAPMATCQWDAQFCSSNLVVFISLPKLACKGYVLFRYVFPVPGTSWLLKSACSINGYDTWLSQRVLELFSRNAALFLDKPLKPTQDLLRKPSNTVICYFWNFTEVLLGQEPSQRQ